MVKLVAPLVWPGWRCAVSVVPPSDIVSPSLNVRSTVAGAKRAEGVSPKRKSAAPPDSSSAFSGSDTMSDAPVIFFNLVLQTIEGFKAFTQAFIVSGGTGGPIDSTLFYSLYLYIEAFANFRMGYASALAWLLLVIIAIFTAIAFGTSKYWVYYEDESR